MAKRSETNDLGRKTRLRATEMGRSSAGDSESEEPGRSTQPVAESESLDAEIERRIVEDSQSAAPDQVFQPPPAQPAPAASALLAPDAELDDAALAAAIFVPPLD